MLCVNNLSRFPNWCEVMLEQLAGKIPIELTGRVPFPPIGELPYFVTLVAARLLLVRARRAAVRGRDADPAGRVGLGAAC